MTVFFGCFFFVFFLQFPHYTHKHTIPPPFFLHTNTNTSHMTPAQFQAHHADIEYLASQLGIPPPSRLGAATDFRG